MAVTNISNPVSVHDDSRDGQVPVPQLINLSSSMVTSASTMSLESNGRLPKSVSNSDLTDATDLPSDSDSMCDEVPSTTSLDDSNRLQDQIQGNDFACSQRRVRFSVVHTREFEEALGAVDRESRPSFKSRDSITSIYTDTESDIETHLSEKIQRRKERYVQMMQNRLHQSESGEEQEQQAQKQNEKKKGFRSRVLKPIWKGFIETVTISPMVVPMPGY